MRRCSGKDKICVSNSESKLDPPDSSNPLSNTVILHSIDANVVNRASARERKSANFQKAKSYTSSIRFSMVDRKVKEFPWEISLGDVSIKEKIGKGGFGMVHRGEWNGQQVAIKKLRKESTSDFKVIRSFLKEISLLSDANHPNILKFIGASVGSTVCLITEYCALGDLTSYLQENEIDWKTKL